MQVILFFCLLIGLILGNSGLNILNHVLIGQLSPVIVLGIGWIGLILGMNFDLKILKKIELFAYLCAAVHIIISFIIIVFTILAILYYTYNGNIDRFIVPVLFLAVVALTTDPAIAAKIIKKGKTKQLLFTRLVQIVLLTDIAVVFAFAVVLSIYHLHSTSFIFEFMPLLILKDLSLTVFIGGSIGFLCTIFLKKLTEGRDVLMMILVAVVFGCGVSLYMKVSALLMSFVLGFVLVNFSFNKRNIVIRVIKQLEMPLYISFLILAGAILNIKFVALYITAIVVYILVRIFGKFIGAMVMGKMVLLSAHLRPYLGLAILAQGGLSVVLALNIYLEADGIVKAIIPNLLLMAILLNQIIGYLGMKIILNLFSNVKSRETC